MRKLPRAEERAAEDSNPKELKTDTMNILEEAIIYATVMHQGKVRKLRGNPFILHPIEVAQILSTMTDDQEIITAGILHDIVEDTDGTLGEIEKRFGKRVADLVASESETEILGETAGASWKRRKETALLVLKNSQDIGVPMLWLADKLANVRSIAGIYSEQGEALWQRFDQKDIAMQRWYYQSVAELVELQLNKTGAFKEYIQHINYLFPGTYDSVKTRYRKYREISVDGCRFLGRGAKGDVYRYDDELVVKVFNRNNTYQDVEREISLSRKAFVLGIPTAISFGIVAVGERYGAMYELVDSETFSKYIAASPGQVDAYAGMMAELAHTIHGIRVTEDDGFPPVSERLHSYIAGGIAYEDEALAEKCRRLVDSLPETHTLVHGDFHTGNVFLHRGEPLLIDMDRVSVGHPIAELSDLCYYYVVLGEDDPSVIENFMGFSYPTALRFFDSFLKSYLGTEDEDRLREVKDKASLLCYTRMIRKIRKKGALSGEDQEAIARCKRKIADLTARLTTLAF